MSPTMRLIVLWCTAPQGVHVLVNVGMFSEESNGEMGLVGYSAVSPLRKQDPRRGAHFLSSPASREGHFLNEGHSAGVGP